MKVVRTQTIRQEIPSIRELKCPHCKSQDYAFIPQWSFREVLAVVPSLLIDRYLIGALT